jgi:hypothetical protein
MASDLPVLPARAADASACSARPVVLVNVAGGASGSPLLWPFGFRCSEQNPYPKTSRAGVDEVVQNGGRWMPGVAGSAAGALRARAGEEGLRCWEGSG